MTSPRRRNRSLHFDLLERRETPSSTAVSPLITHPLAVGHRTGHFQAIGTGKLVGMPSSVEGGSFMASATGRASRLRSFTGLLNVTSENGGATVHIELHGKHRSSLQIIMTVLGTGENGSPSSFQGTYAITGGTGRAARATGGGTATGTLSPQTLSLTFDLNGRISP